MTNVWTATGAMNVNDVWDDSALIEMYEQSLQDIKSASAGVTEKDFTDAEGNTTTWKVGGHCMAPYEEDGQKSYYPATIVSIGGKDNLQVEVTFFYYGNKAVVHMEELWINEEAIAHAVASEEAKKSNAQTIDASCPYPSSSSIRVPLPGVTPVPPNIIGVVPPANENEAMNSALMSWYMAGYHSGYLQAIQEGKASRK